MCKFVYYAFFGRSARGDRITGWSCMSAWSNSRTTGKYGWNSVWVLFPWGLPHNCTFEYPTIGSNKTADEKYCEVGLRVAPIAMGWDKEWGYEGYNGHHVDQEEEAIREVTMVTFNGTRQYVGLPVRCCILVTKVGTMSQAKTLAGIIRISIMATTVNNIKICTVVTIVMRVYRHVSGESVDRLVYASVVCLAPKNCKWNLKGSEDGAL
jgi:hypothetical protein